MKKKGKKKTDIKRKIAQDETLGEMFTQRKHVLPKCEDKIIAGEMKFLTLKLGDEIIGRIPLE